MTSPHTLFEVSWEVCNKVGGIHTVLSTKARSLVERHGDDYVAVGPWLLSTSDGNHEFEEERGFQAFCESCRAMGLPVRVGRWRIPGRPRAILIEFSKLYEKKDAVLTKLWEDYKVDSIHGGWDYVEPLLFGHAAGMVIERWWEEYLAPEHERAVVNAHEWMTSAALLYLKKKVPSIGTVFTTHATMLGRTLSSNHQSPDDGLGEQTPEGLAKQHNVPAKHSLESVAAREADVFTTVSEITAKEAKLLLGRAPEPITTNGLDVSVIDELAGATTREEARRMLLHTASRFFGEDVTDAALLAVSGRYEFHNKGIDILLDALAKLDRRKGRRIVLFVLVPAGNSGLRSEFLERKDKPLDELEGALGLSTHNLFDPERDPVRAHCERLGLRNDGDARVRVIHVPIYLTESDGLWNLPYQAVLRAFDLTCFPSYYEPWGYTPQESLALGVPTITSDYAGFGRWAKDAGLGPQHGVTVLDRVHVRYEDVVETLAAHIERELARGQSARELAGTCRETAQRSTWQKFLPRYEQAYRTALECVQKRLEAGVLQTRRPKQPLTVQPAPEGKRPHLFHFDVAATLPEALRGLLRLSRNLWWSWDHEASALFRELSPRSWETSGHNPVTFLQRVYPEDLAARAADAGYVARLEQTLARFDAYLAAPFEPAAWPAPAEGATTATPEHPVAYFCAEYGIHESLRIYSGGLGILAGDHLKSASDLGLPLVAVGLFYRMGYTTQRIGPAGEQLAVDLENDPRSLPLEVVKDETGGALTLELPLPGRQLRVQAWRVRVGRVHLYLLDANRPENRPEDRDITRNLYGGNEETRLLQEIVLGRGGQKLLRRLEIRPAVFHMNEGHAAFLTLERVGQLAHEEGLTFDEAREFVRATTIFTTHTPVPAGHDRFGEDLMRRYFSDAATWVGVPWERFMQLGQADGEKGAFNMTYLALNLASFANGVSDMHGTASRKLLRPLWPGLLESEVPIDAIVNGVHLPSWTAPAVARALGAGPGTFATEDFARALTNRQLLDLRAAKQELRRHLIEQMRARLSRAAVVRGDSPALLARALEGLDPQALWIGFARRFAPYKRAALLFQDPARLSRLLDDPARPVRVVFAGKAHPNDGLGKDLVKRVFELTRRPEFQGRVFFLEDYDANLARALVQGVDVWLNTPIRWLEASGTSGMKAAANGTLNLSIGDGWWPEAFDGENGWLIGGGEYRDQALLDQFDASTLYSTLEEEVVPAYFERDAEGLPARWLERVQRCLASVPLRFNTHRMVRDYHAKAYGPLAAAFDELRRNKRWKLKMLVQENQRVRRGFGEIRIVSVHVGELSSLHVGDPVEVRAEVNLGALKPDDVHVELVLGHAAGEAELTGRTAVPLAFVSSPGNDVHVFEGVRPMERSGSFSYGIRVRARTDREHAGSLRDLVLWA
ncbi:MAG TPA: alpha-glucan family phosphorylase [Planctomycetota bacterium]